MLGITKGGSENATVVKGLLDDLIERGLDPTRPRLYALDGGKALQMYLERGYSSSVAKFTKNAMFSGLVYGFGVRKLKIGIQYGNRPMQGTMMKWKKALHLAKLPTSNPDT